MQAFTEAKNKVMYPQELNVLILTLKNIKFLGGFIMGIDPSAISPANSHFSKANKYAT